MKMLKSGLPLFLLAAATPAWADVLEMKTGQKIEAPVLKEASDALYVDLGFDVVRIPTAMISKRHHKGDKPAAPSATSEDECYLTARLPVRTVKELTATYGEGVVLVQTPAGLGSGFLINTRGYCVTNYHVIERETRVAVTLFHRGAGENSSAGGSTTSRLSRSIRSSTSPCCKFPNSPISNSNPSTSVTMTTRKREMKSSRLEIRWDWSGRFRGGLSVPATAVFRGSSISRRLRKSIRATAADRCSTRGAKSWASRT